MSTGLRLSDYSTTPLYNIKAVVQATELTPSTLRAWERRYNMCEPQRSESGYRLYSDRDIAVIRWLKSQVDAGMSISQAVSWLEKLSDQASGRANAVLPVTPGTIGTAEIRVEQPPQIATVRSLTTLRAELAQALLAYDDRRADQLFAEAFAMYSMEEIGETLITPVLVQIGDKWNVGEVSVTDEHFATSYLRLRLSTLYHAMNRATDGPLIWIGCAPGELHEMAALLISVYLLRLGYRVHYFGQNLPAGELPAEIGKHHPSMLLLSATTSNAAMELSKLTETLVQQVDGRSVIGYGGQIFVTNPELRATVQGTYMGDSALEGIQSVNNLLIARSPHTRNGS